jgi:hypothetical protein
MRHDYGEAGGEVRRGGVEARMVGVTRQGRRGDERRGRR